MLVSELRVAQPTTLFNRRLHTEHPEFKMSDVMRVCGFACPVMLVCPCVLVGCTVCRLHVCLFVYFASSWQEIGVRWRALSATEKKPFEETAKDLKVPQRLNA